MTVGYVIPLDNSPMEKKSETATVRRRSVTKTTSARKPAEKKKTAKTVKRPVPQLISEEEDDDILLSTASQEPIDSSVRSKKKKPPTKNLQTKKRKALSDTESDSSEAEETLDSDSESDDTCSVRWGKLGLSPPDRLRTNDARWRAVWVSLVVIKNKPDLVTQRADERITELNKFLLEDCLSARLQRQMQGKDHLRRYILQPKMMDSNGWGRATDETKIRAAFKTARSIPYGLDGLWITIPHPDLGLIKLPVSTRYGQMMFNFPLADVLEGDRWISSFYDFDFLPLGVQLPNSWDECCEQGILHQEDKALFGAALRSQSHINPDGHAAAADFVNNRLVRAGKDDETGGNDSSNRYYAVVMYANTAAVNQALSAGYPIPYGRFLAQCCCEFVREMSNRLKLTKLMDSDHIPTLHDGWDAKAEVSEGRIQECMKHKLFPHQLEALLFMLGVEKGHWKNLNTGHDSRTFSPFLIPWLEHDSGILFDMQLKCFRLKEHLNSSDYCQLKSAGGVLADEMGLGKSACVIALSLLNRKNDAEVDALLKGEWFPGKFPVEVDGGGAIFTEPAGENSLPTALKVMHRNTFPSKATVIVCPSQLVAQWKTEICKHTRQKVRVIIISDVHDHSQLTYKDIARADFILINNNMLGNKSFLESGNFGPPIPAPLAKNALHENGNSLVKTNKRRRRNVNGPSMFLQDNEFRDHVLREYYSTPGSDGFSQDGSSYWQLTNDKNLNVRVEVTSQRNNAAKRFIPIACSLTQLVTSYQAGAKDWVLSLAAPSLCHFRFSRFVLDEGHEFLDDPAFLRMAELFVSYHRWYVTGTPLPSEHRFHSLLRFLQVTPRFGLEVWNHCNLNVPLHSLTSAVPALNVKFHESLVWRNTKEGVKRRTGSALLTEGLKEEVILFNLSPVEVGIYRQAVSENMSAESLVRICCHPLVESNVRNIVGIDNVQQALTLDDIRIALIADRRQEVVNKMHRISRSRLEVEDLKAQLRALTTTEQQLSQRLTQPYTDNVQRQLDERAQSRMARELQDIGDAINTKSTQEKRWLKEKTQLENTITFLNTISQGGGDLVCPSCTKTPCLSPVLMQKCGHVLCEDCLATVHSTKLCCVCGIRCNPDEHYPLVTQIEVPTPSPAIAIDDDEETLEMRLASDIQRLGSKMARLVYYLRKMERDTALSDRPERPQRAIIFSQFEFMLRRISEVLDREGIQNVFCEGAVHQRNKSIQRFKTDPRLRVLMLSLEHSASGTNLTEATHIILVDPVLGTSSRAQAIEGQAIGRAYRIGQTETVTVVRLLARNTVEEKIYRDRQSELATQAEVCSKLTTN